MKVQATKEAIRVGTVISMSNGKVVATVTRETKAGWALDHEHKGITHEILLSAITLTNSLYMNGIFIVGQPKSEEYKKNEELLNSIVEYMASREQTPDIRVIVAEKYITSYAEFLEVAKELHSGFQSKTTIKEEMFRCAVIDAEGEVWVNYTADGMQFVNKEKVGSCLSSAGLVEVTVLSQGLIIDYRTHYDECETNRKIWRQQDWKTLMGADDASTAPKRT